METKLYDQMQKLTVFLNPNVSLLIIFGCHFIQESLPHSLSQHLIRQKINPLKYFPALGKIT